MKQLFKDISAAIGAVAGIRWVDFDLGQLEQEERPPVSFPCALVGFDSATFTDLGASAQQGNLTISIRLAFNVFERTHSKAATAYRDVGLAHLDTLQSVHNALQGLSGEGFNSLTRTSFVNEKRMDLRVYQLTYATVTDEPNTPGGGSPHPEYASLKDLVQTETEFCLEDVVTANTDSGIGIDWDIPDTNEIQ